MPEEISITALRADLATYLARAQAGQAFIVTSRGRPIARIVGAGVPSNADAGIARLIASGAATWNGGKPTGTPVTLSPGGKSVSETVTEDRG